MIIYYLYLSLDRRSNKITLSRHILSDLLRTLSKKNIHKMVNNTKGVWRMTDILNIESAVTPRDIKGGGDWTTSRDCTF
jgi:hypothetical protein